MKTIKRTFGLFGAVLMFAALSVPARADLLGLGNGLIYDTGSNTTWLQNADLAATNTFGVAGIGADGRMTGPTADLWIAAMNSADYLGFNDWRLPISGDGCLPSYVPCLPFSLTHHEFSELWLTELGNTVPVPSVSGQTLINTGPFTNVQNGPCCSGLVEGPYWTFIDGQLIGAGPVDPSAEALFYMGAGNETDVTLTSGDEFYAWAVLPGNASESPGPSTTPEPGTLSLLGPGLAGLVWIARKRRRLNT